MMGQKGDLDFAFSNQAFRQAAELMRKKGRIMLGMITPMSCL